MSHNTMWDGVRQRGDGGHAGLRAGVDVTGQPVAGGLGGRRKEFKAPLQRPDAPQWRAGGIADSAGGQIQVRVRRGTRVCRRLKSDECSHGGFMKL